MTRAPPAIIAISRAGSWAIETLTAEIERRVLDTIAEIDQLGGALRCIESGWFVDEIGRSAYRDQRAIEEGRRRVVGVNCYQETEDSQEIEIFRGDPRVEQEQIARLQRVRADRDAGGVERAFDALEVAARAGASIVPPTIEAVRSYATVGEISARLQVVLGTHKASQHV